MSLTRREFLATGVLASLSLPLISGCQKKTTPESATSEIIKPNLVSNKPGYFEKNFGITPEIIDKVLAKTMSRGGSFGDLFFEHKRTGSLSIKDNIITNAYSSVTLGMGARCVNKDQVGYAYTEALTLEDMLRTAEAASSIAPSKDSVEIKSRHDLDVKRYYSQTIDWNTFDVSNAIALVQKIESQARKKSPDIVQVTASMEWEQRNIMINTSDGINAEDRQPIYRLGLIISIKRGEVTETGFRTIGAKADFESITQDSIDKLINDTYEMTEMLFNAIKPKEGEWPIVLQSGHSAVLLHEAIGHGLEADFNRKGYSIFSTMMNQRVASDDVTIGDTGLIDNLYGAYNIDDEGTPCEDTILVENGILKSYLHDRISAEHYKLHSTGSGRRESYKFKPIPRMRATYMKNGPHEREELLEGIEYGIYCIDTGNGRANIGQGDFQFMISNGYLIEHGKLTAPIKNINLIGNGPKTLSKIVMVANDFDYSPGGYSYCGKENQKIPVSFDMPSVRISGIYVGG